MVFRRATSSHYRASPQVVEGPRSTHCCGHCPRCPWILEGTTYTLPNGEVFSPPQHSNCGTRGVVYLMVCVCKVLYVGKTIKELRQRLGDHLYYSTNGKLTMVGHHIGIHHRFQPESVKFLVLESIPEDPRGGRLGSRDPENARLFGLSDSTPSYLLALMKRK